MRRDRLKGAYFVTLVIAFIMLCGMTEYILLVTRK